LTIPNSITTARILLIPLFMVCMSYDWIIAAMLLFAGVSLTDYLDGYLARKMNQVTDLGKVLDPLADKLLVTAAIICFVDDGRMEAWMATVIIAREMIISTLRAVTAAKGLVLEAGLSGKIKTVIQMLGILFMLSPWHYMMAPGTQIYWFVIAAWLITVVTVWSGADYLWEHRRILRKL